MREYTWKSRIDDEENCEECSSSGSGSCAKDSYNLNINNDNNLMNYWGIGWDMSFSAEVFEDDDLYRDDRALVVKDNAWQNYRIWFSTDRRKKIILKPSFQIDKGELRDWGNQLALDVTIKPTDFINLRINNSEI